MEINLTAEISKFDMQHINRAIAYRSIKPLGKLITIKMRYDYVPGHYRWQLQQVCNLEQLKDYIDNILPSFEMSEKRSPAFNKAFDKLQELLAKIEDGYIPDKIERRV